MANTMEYAKVFQSELDKQIVESSTSGWMEENASQVIYYGGNEIKIPKVTLKGLADYDRDSGYAGGAVTYSYETMSMSMDRGRRFRIDALDVDETGFAVAAANVASEFQRTQVIPEIDSYRYSKLAQAAGITKYSYTPAKTTVLSTLIDQITEVREVVGGEGELVICMARSVYDMLMLSSEVTHSIDNGNFTQGGLDLNIRTICGAAVIPVPSSRMMSKYDFDSSDGFSAASGASQINWIICPKDAPIAVSKTDNVKIVTPEQNQFADAWDIDYRKYHDLFIPDNKKAAIAVCSAGAASD
ncbi:MAG: hypothetical protein J1F04_01360 [Oscillospiraceae bacterium]|nr:hypothetical protein [Oscillospiraceae bacterium]